MGVNKQLSWGVILMYVQMFLNVVINIVCTPIIINFLGQSEYGLYNLAASIISYLSLFTLGFGASYIRFYSRYKAKNDEESIKKLNGLFLVVFCILGAIALVAGGFLIQNVEILFNASYSAKDLKLAKTLMVFLTINMTLSFPMSVFHSYITSQEKFIFQKLVNLGRTVLSPILNIVFLYLGYGSVAMVVISTGISILVDIVNIAYCFGKLNFRVKIGKLEKGLLKEIFFYSLFIAINLLIDQINGQTDKLILGKMINASAVAIYAVADHIRNLYVMLSTSISGVFAPSVHRIINSNEENKDEKLTELFTKIGRIQYYVLFLVLSGFIFFGQNFIRIWVGDEFSIAYVLILLLIVPAIIPLIQNVGIEIQRAKNKHQFRSIVYLFVAFLNLGISILLCKYIGIVGVALGTCISNIIGTIIIMNIYYHKKIGLNIIHFWKEIAKATMGMIPAILTGVLMMLLIDFSNIWIYFGCIAIYSIIYLLGIYFFSFNETEKSFVDLILTKLKLKKRKIENNQEGK